MAIENRKAYHDYDIRETLECGIALKGNEVKSISKGMCSIKEAWVAVENGNLVLKNMHVTKWDTANMFDVDERRDRRLLAHKKEILHFESKLKEKGYTSVPLKVYGKGGKFKVFVGLAVGKRNYDKRNAIKERDIQREVEREYKQKF